MIANPDQRQHPQSQPNVAVSNILHDGVIKMLTLMHPYAAMTIIILFKNGLQYLLNLILTIGIGLIVMVSMYHADSILEANTIYLIP